MQPEDAGSLPLRVDNGDGDNGTPQPAAPASDEPAFPQDSTQPSPERQLVTSPGLVESRVEHQWVPEILALELPPEVEGEVDEEVQERLSNFLDKNARLGQSLNQNLVNLKTFRNPNIYTKLIEVYNIKEYGSNFSADHDLYSLPASSFYDELWKAQKLWNEQRDRDRAKRTEVGFVSSKATEPPTVSATSQQQQQAAAAAAASVRASLNKVTGVARMLQSSRMTGSIFSNTPAEDTQQQQKPVLLKRKSKWDLQTQTPPTLTATTLSTAAVPDAETHKKQKT